MIPLAPSPAPVLELRRTHERLLSILHRRQAGAGIFIIL
ncbi:MAG: hypothetical protein JWO94_402, partial [Verrucomicrobiaceae bacterium]|nr:hypothetical protein [Verrucomicrobiaceae bacterium]